MIKNERQYRITKSQADKFALSLAHSASSPSTAQLHPLLQKAQQDALRSQFEELQAQIEEYEALRSGKRQVLEVESFNELPRALIQARIATGLSQKELAERLGLKEQQIQQYESTDYAGASMSRVQAIINALGILVREEVFLPNADVTKTKLFQRMQSIGIERDLILRRILSKPLAARLQSETKTASNNVGSVALEAATALGRIFDLKPSSIFGNMPLNLNSGVLGSARFKLPARIDEKKTTAYTVYSHYLALLSLDVTRRLASRPIPNDALGIRREIIGTYGTVSFETALQYIWSLGIPVLPLSDAGSFHGACWRVSGRNIIVLKQQAKYPARWLNDSLHELGHARQEPEKAEHSVVETEDILRSQQMSSEEEDAQFFAEDIIFEGRADDIAVECTKRAGHHMERLATVVPQVANEQNVPVDALANYIAFSLSQDGRNWWGAATNLQDKRINPWALARDMFLEHADMSLINEVDRALLLQALTDEEE